MSKNRLIKEQREPVIDYTFNFKDTKGKYLLIIDPSGESFRDGDGDVSFPEVLFGKVISLTDQEIELALDLPIITETIEKITGLTNIEYQEYYQRISAGHEITLDDYKLYLGSSENINNCTKVCVFDKKPTKQQLEKLLDPFIPIELDGDIVEFRRGEIEVGYKTISNKEVRLIASKLID